MTTAEWIGRSKPRVKAAQYVATLAQDQEATAAQHPDAINHNLRHGCRFGPSAAEGGTPPIGLAIRQKRQRGGYPGGTRPAVRREAHPQADTGASPRAEG